jgi:translation initiation factor IF-3
MFRGREMDHKEMGYRILDRLTKELVHVGTVDRQPEFEGRFMIMYMSPLPARVVAKPREKKTGDASPGKEVDHAEVEDKSIGEETVS